MANDHARNPMLARLDDRGRPLYKITEGGNVARTRKITPATRRRVLDRDGHACVWCAATVNLHLDHIIRYADGGSNRDENLRVLCSKCHAKRGGSSALVQG